MVLHRRYCKFSVVSSSCFFVGHLITFRFASNKVCIVGYWPRFPIQSSDTRCCPPSQLQYLLFVHQPLFDRHPLQTLQSHQKYIVSQSILFIGVRLKCPLERKKVLRSLEVLSLLLLHNRIGFDWNFS